MERTKDNIRTYAELGYLEYIDGYAAQITSQKPCKDQDGTECWEVVLNPTDKLISRYGLISTNNSMLYTQKIPVDSMIQLNADPTNNRWLCLITYKGEETHVSGILKGVTQQKLIAEWKKRCGEFEAKAQVATEKLRQMENNLPKYMKDNLAPIMEQFTPMLKDIAKGASSST